MAGGERLLGGLRAWTWQRVSALYLLGFGLVLAIRLVATPLADYAQWHAFWTAPPMATATLLAVVSLAVHAWVGGRDVILDYVRPRGARPVALALLALLIGLAVTRILLALLAVAQV